MFASSKGEKGQHPFKGGKVAWECNIKKRPRAKESLVPATGKGGEAREYETQHLGKF